MIRQALAIALIAAAACGKASDEGEAKQWPGEQPPKDVAIPASLSIAVTVDGVAKPALTADVLKGKKPDFADSDRKAWLVTTLVAEAPGSIVEAFGPNGVSVSFAQPTKDGLESVVFLTRRGEAIFSAIDPKDPFPGFHGRGGRLHRPGDSMPHVSSITRLEITHPRP